MLPMLLPGVSAWANMSKGEPVPAVLKSVEMVMMSSVVGPFIGAGLPGVAC